MLQDNIDTVTVERDDNVGEEDWIKVKSEGEFCTQLVQTVKAEEEVSVGFGVFCGSDLFTGVCARVVQCI
jgi:hypothetical protein